MANTYDQNVKLQAIADAITNQSITITTGQDLLDALADIATAIQSGGSASDDYSTTEQVIGTWIDGKPIYRKTFEVNFHTNGQVWVDTGCVINDIETLVDYKITAADTYVNEAPANVTAALFRYNNSNIQIFVNSAWYLDVQTITVEYTKSTD